MKTSDFQEKQAFYKTQIEEYLSQSLPSKDCLQHSVLDAMQYSLMAGGKRLRGMLVLEFCRICKGDWKNALPFAAALEMIHAYSLIHDDLPCMDDDDLRRGKPSCHIAFGEATALLAGDGLLTYAFEMASHPMTQVPPENQLRAVSELAKAAGTYGMIGGQVLDISYENQSIDHETLSLLHRMKTGALIRAAAKLGCIAAGATAQQEEAADQYAQNIGLAFQIIDDILDAAGDPALLGKPTGSDEENHKTTYVTLYGLEQAKQEALRITEAAKSALMAQEWDCDFLLSLADSLIVRQS